MQRLDKILSSAGAGTRKELRAAIRAGRVTVNGSVCRDESAKFDETNAQILLDGEPVELLRPALILLNKPAGYLTAADDPRQKTVMDLIPARYRRFGVMPVGRLDKDTEGLLLFTDDGMLDVRLLRPERHVEKEYEYRAFGHLDEAALRQLETGVVLAEGQPLSRPARAALLAHTTIGESEAYLPERFREKYLKNPGRPVTAGKLWITEGRKHQVKLMVKAVGAHVFYLKRWAIGPVRLDAALAPGAYRPLTPEELHALGL